MKSNPGNIEIAFDKRKVSFLLFGSVAFVLIGIWFSFFPPYVYRGEIEIFIRITGLICILFFGLGGYFFFKKLNDPSPALIISPLGVTDNSSAICAGFIPWTDIIEISDSYVLNQVFVNIVVSNPQTYIEKLTNPIKRNLAKMNYSGFGVAIGISCNGLKTSHEELRSLLKEAFRQYKR